MKRTLLINGGLWLFDDEGSSFVRNRVGIEWSTQLRFHTGVLPEGAGVHNYPTPTTDVDRFRRDDFVLWGPKK
jgi:hypothetical protein